MMIDNKEIMILDEQSLKEKVYWIRDQQVMLDYDLAQIYGYTTTRFNEQIARNIDRFEDDFMFQLTKEEFQILISQNEVGVADENCRGHLQSREFICS